MYMNTLAAAIIGAVVAPTGLSAPATADTLPGVVVDYGMVTPVVKVRPSTFQPFKDIYYTSVRWSKLTSTMGYATGVRHINTCNPSCADANYITDRVSMKFTKVRMTPTKKRAFSQLQVTVVDTYSLPISGI